MPVLQYAHPQFRYHSSTQRFRRGLWLALACFGVVGISAAMMAPLDARKSDAAMAPGGQVSRPEAIPTASPAGYAAANPQLSSEHGPQVIAQKPFCLDPGQSNGSCISFQLPKVRMVRVPRASTLGQHGKSGVAATPKLTEVDKGIAEPKKAQRSAHHQSQRRNQLSHRTPSRGDVRVADRAARGYGYGDYGRQGFSRNFW